MKEEKKPVVKCDLCEKEGEYWQLGLDAPNTKRLMGFLCLEHYEIFLLATKKIIYPNRIVVVELTEAIKRLMGWTPEGVDLKKISKFNWGNLDCYEKGDEECPFFSEAYLYNLLGKEDARTLLALIRQAFESVGVDIEKIREGEE